MPVTVNRNRVSRCFLNCKLFTPTKSKTLSYQQPQITSIPVTEASLISHLTKAMATLCVTPFPSLTLAKQLLPTKLPSLKLNYRAGRSLKTTVRSYKVLIEHEGQSTELEVEPDETILSKALDSGLPVPHDCKLGVCMTCPAKLISGTVDQSEGMLSDDVVERGYALLCASYPKSDCHIRTIPEDELLSLQLATAND